MFTAVSKAGAVCVLAVNGRCAYCAMTLDHGKIRARIDGQALFFCSQRCLAVFRTMGPQGRVKAQIQAERSKILGGMEEKRGTQVLTLIHRREPWSEKDGGYITIEDTEGLLTQIRQTPSAKPIDLIIHTPGGIALAAEMIAMAVRQHPGKVTAIVPYYAMSGGTLVALAAHKLLMEEESVLGPLDPQIDAYPARSLIDLVSRKPVETISDQMMILSDIAQKSVRQIRDFVKWILEEKLDPPKREAVAKFLTEGYVLHDTPIVPQILRSLGLKVEGGVPAEVYQLFRTFEFGTCARPQTARY